MMGHGHATMGAAAWIALAASSPAGFNVLPLDATGVAVGALACAGAALLPDADHHSGTIAYALPPLTTVLTKFVEGVSGGHRHATHSFLGVLAFFALAWAVTPIRAPIGGHDIQIGAFILLVFLVACALKVLRLTRGWVDSWALSVGIAAALTWFAPHQYWWLPAAVGIGALVHLAGDLLTVQGLALLWPWVPKPAIETPFWKANGYMSVPILGTAGSWREWVFVSVIDVYVLWALMSMYAPGVLPWLWEQATSVDISYYSATGQN